MKLDKELRRTGALLLLLSSLVFGQSVSAAAGISLSGAPASRVSAEPAVFAPGGALQEVVLSGEEKERLEFLLSGLSLPKDGEGAFLPAEWSEEQYLHLLWNMVRMDFVYTSPGEEDTSKMAGLGISREIGNAPNYEAVYARNDMEAFSLSAFGRGLPGNLSQSGIRITDTEVGFTFGDGAPFCLQKIDTAFLQGSRFFVEGISVYYSNIEVRYEGRFRAELKRNDASLFGYTLLSFEKVCGPEYTAGLSASASSTLPDEGSYTYPPSMVLDGDPVTAWVEGAAGNGEGEWIQLSGTQPFSFTGLVIRAGYQKDPTTFTNNGRPTKLLMECSDGSAWEMELPPGRGETVIPMGQRLEESWIRFTIQEVNPGSKYEDTCISEISLMNWKEPVPAVFAGEPVPVISAAPAEKPEETPAPSVLKLTLYCCASEYVTLRAAADRGSAALTRITSRQPVEYLGASGEFYYVSYGGMTGYVLMDFFSLDPAAPLNYGSGSAKVEDSIYLYCRASEYVTLRSIPDRSGDALDRIPTRGVCTYLGSIGEFYYISYKGKTGYALQEFFSTNPNAALNYGTGSVSSEEGIYLYCCASQSATLRGTPSRDGEALLSIPSRDRVQYVSSIGEFYLVYYQERGGYVLKDFFSTDPYAPLNYGSGSDAAPGETILTCIASESVTLRNTAARTGQELTQIPSRAQVTYLGTVGEFYYVSYGGMTGYALKDYFSTDPDAPLNYGTR